MNNCYSAFIVTALFLMASPAIAGWQWTNNDPQIGYMSITENYIHPISQGSADRVIVLVMEKSFHSCGWNTAANINSSIVGEQLFDVLTSAFLSAWMANKKVSLLIDGCDTNRAKIFGLRIAP